MRLGGMIEEKVSVHSAECSYCVSRHGFAPPAHGMRHARTAAVVTPSRRRRWWRGGDGIQRPMYTGSVRASFRRSTAATAGAGSRLASLWRGRRLAVSSSPRASTSCRAVTQRAPASFSNRNVTILLYFCKVRKCFGNFQFPTLQRVSPEIIFDFWIDSSRVDAISGLLCNLMAAWKPEVNNFHIPNCHKGLRGSPPSHRVTPSFPPPPPL
jgi:hypothetical protein